MNTDPPDPEGTSGEAVSPPPDAGSGRSGGRRSGGRRSGRRSGSRRSGSRSETSRSGSRSEAPPVDGAGMPNSSVEGLPNTPAPPAVPGSAGAIAVPDFVVGHAGGSRVEAVQPGSSGDLVDLRSAEQTSGVLHRAMELADIDASGLETLLGRESLIDIARQLEVPLDAVASAVVEARLDVDQTTRGLLDRLVGPGEIFARRSTNEAEAEVVARLMDWLEVGHGLKPREGQYGVVIAKPRRGLIGKVSRGVRNVQGVGGLANAGTVEAIVVDLDDEAEGAVGLNADITERRSGAVVKGSIVALGGTVAVTLMSAVVAPAALIALPIAAGAGLFTSRRLHGATVKAMTDAVEETIDGVVTKTEPPRLLDGLRKRRR